MQEAIILPGGGARGAFQVGCLQRLINEQGVDPDVISGVSVGALNAAILAQHDAGSGIDHLSSIWEGIRGNSDIYQTRFPGWPRPELNLAFRDSMYHLRPLEHLLRKHLDIELLRDSDTELRVAAVNLQRGDLVTATQHSPDLFKWILASASIPGIFPPVRIMEDLYGDGGVVDVSPMAATFKALRDMGTKEARVYVISTQPLHMPSVTSQTLQRGANVVRRTVELMISEILRNDIENARWINRLVKAGEHDGVEADIQVIAPDEPPMDTLDFSPQSIRNAIREGRLHA